MQFVKCLLRFLLFSITHVHTVFNKIYGGTYQKRKDMSLVFLQIFVGLTLDITESEIGIALMRRRDNDAKRHDAVNRWLEVLKSIARNCVFTFFRKHKLKSSDKLCVNYASKSSPTAVHKNNQSIVQGKIYLIHNMMKTHRLTTSFIQSDDANNTREY